MTKGTKTTEFWLAVVVVVAATILTAMGNLTEGAWAQAVALVAGGYAISRGLAKHET